MSVSRQKKDAVLERDGHECSYCGRSLRYSLVPHDRQPDCMIVVGEYPTIDHALPKSRGGGELFVMLMAEVAMRQIPETKSEHVAAVFAERRVYSRVRGSFGRSPLSRSVRRDVFERDGGACRYCGVSISWGEYECDHVEPVSKGGTDALTNLVAACEPCNRSKGAKTLAEWRRG